VAKLTARTRGLVAFDLDGTLLRGPTVCEILATAAGCEEETRAFEAVRGEAEIAAGRLAMARRYRDVPETRLLASLSNAEWAGGAHQGVALLQDAGYEVAIASITWGFAVRWFAEALGVRWHLGTELTPDGEVVHVWPRDKGRWLRRLGGELSVPPGRIAAVGDSAGDVELLGAASLRVFVGATVPGGLDDVHHWPGAPIDSVADRVLELWESAEDRMPGKGPCRI
jgi:HAD superfamily phosphoserine phosphatase-like hydrolase